MAYKGRSSWYSSFNLGNDQYDWQNGNHLWKKSTYLYCNIDSQVFQLHGKIVRTPFEKKRNPDIFLDSKWWRRLVKSNINRLPRNNDRPSICLNNIPKIKKLILLIIRLSIKYLLSNKSLGLIVLDSHILMIIFKMNQKEKASFD